MVRIYRLVIAVVLAVLLGTIACAPVRGPSGGGGMMGGGQGGGMMGPGGMMGGGTMGGMPMMGGTAGYYSDVPTPLSPDKAKTIAGNYLLSLNNPDLKIDEFEEDAHNFYRSLIEPSIEKGAFEIIIDRYSGNLQPEPQSMMWNT
ncbi:MAG: hypothetical protein HYY41_02710, partial [Chloroflexi bacterium]|nr:hypothetical protein [Chloroflexota bacterium]